MITTASVESAFNLAPQLLVTVNSPAAAPEPGSMTLIAASVVAFSFWRWRNRPGYQARCRSVSGAGYPSNRSMATI
jgi:hypothetical protein